MNIIGIIPARMASTRFPDKPMVKIKGMPMIGHCYLRSKMCKLLNDIYVATCDKEIFNYIDSLGGKAVMTADTHERASDRAAEALMKIEKETGKKADIVVMLQGDEPLVTPKMIEESIIPLLNDPTVNITNLMTSIGSKKEHEDPNEVKVVVDKDSHALYYSREPIPSRKKGVENVPMFKQIGLIPFRRDFLLQYNSMEQTTLEIIESVDMMRILENGMKIKMVNTDEITYSVDTIADLDSIEEALKNDELIDQYLNP